MTRAFPVSLQMILNLMLMMNNLFDPLIARYTHTAMIGVYCTPMGFTYDMCPMMMMGGGPGK